MITWENIPWSLWAYGGVLLIGVASLGVGGHVRIVSLIITLLLACAWLYFLLKGIRGVWIAAVLISASVLAVDLISESFSIFGLGAGLLNLGLLLLPITRRYCGVGSIKDFR
jgi:hypothetical protein